MADVMKIPYDEIPTFDEIFAVGTAAALVPIKSITMKSRNDKFSYGNGSGEPGPACLKLLKTLKGIQQGKIKDEFGWCDKVEEPKGWEGATAGQGNVTKPDQLP